MAGILFILSVISNFFRIKHIKTCHNALFSDGTILFSRPKRQIRGTFIPGINAPFMVSIRHKKKPNVRSGRKGDCLSLRIHKIGIISFEQLSPSFLQICI